MKPSQLLYQKMAEINKIIKKLNDEGKIDEYVQQNHELAEKSAEE